MPNRAGLLFRDAETATMTRIMMRVAIRWTRVRARRSASTLSPAGSDGKCNGSDSNSNSNSNSDNTNNLNLSLFGPPGSGKGSYGKHFAKALNIPLVTTSDVLRRLRPDLASSMADGKLVDDAVVGDTVLEGLLQLSSIHGDSHGNNRNPNGYILDGFPRTLRQVALMEATWPEFLRIRSIVHLEVPDFVCEAKLLGRRACSRCGTSYNVHGVDTRGWKMPPHLPREGHVCVSRKSSSFQSSPSPSSPVVSQPQMQMQMQPQTNTSCDWTVRRDDDTPEIVRERLKVYHENADPILEYTQKNNQSYNLLTLAPYHGFDDLPGLVETLRRHVSGRAGMKQQRKLGDE